MKAKSKASQIITMIYQGEKTGQIVKKTGATHSYVGFIRRRMRTAEVPGFGTVTVKKEGAAVKFDNAVPPSKAASILDEAKAIIYGDREKTYGTPDKNLRMIADLWAAYKGVDFSAEDVCQMMILLKVARLKNDPEHRDSQVDLCGYAALMERIQK